MLNIPYSKIKKLTIIANHNIKLKQNMLSIIRLLSYKMESNEPLLLETHGVYEDIHQTTFGQTVSFDIPSHGNFGHYFTVVITVNGTPLSDINDDWIKLWNELTKTNNKCEQYERRQLKIGCQCPISFDNIENGDKYMRCPTCSNVFSYDVLINWLSLNRTCPLCRSGWNNNDIYINEREHVPKSVVKYNKMTNNKHYLNNKLKKKLDIISHKQQSKQFRHKNKQFNNYR